MMKNRRETLLTQLAAPIVEGLGFTLWGVLAPAAGTKAVVTLFIEGPDGVNLDDCAKVSRDVGLAIEVEDAMPGAYRLEVSSPGFERRFFELQQMVPYIGRKVKVEIDQPKEGRRKFSATLTELGDDAFTLEDDEKILHRIGWDEVTKARLVHEF